MIGTLCVFDLEPRVLDDDQARALSALADRIVDLLELELRSRELERAQQELQRSNEQLTAFAGQVSHDLLNPLTAVSMSLRLAQEQLEEPGGGSRVPWLLERAVGGAERMQSLIDDLLALAGSAAGLSRLPVPLDEWCATSAGPRHRSGDGHGRRRPVCRASSATPWQLRAVLQNLVANAAQKL